MGAAVALPTFLDSTYALRPSAAADTRATHSGSRSPPLPRVNHSAMPLSFGVGGGGGGGSPPAAYPTSSLAHLTSMGGLPPARSLADITMANHPATIAANALEAARAAQIQQQRALQPVASPRATPRGSHEGGFSHTLASPS